MRAARATWFFLVGGIFGLVLCAGPACAQQDLDRERYHRAVEYCRGTAWRPIALSPDRQILCFDGILAKDMHVSLAGLNEGGLFVVRSAGGNQGPAVALSDLIRQHRATVIVYDYCLSACAVFLLIASHQTFVVKGTLVAWHYPQSTDENYPFCTSLQVPLDGGPKKLRRGLCRNDSTEMQLPIADWPVQFFKERAVSPLFDGPPDSLYVRRIIRNRYLETGEYRDTYWTIHPRYYPTLFKTKIIYEAYPKSQQEVDDMVAKLRMDFSVIYDP